MFRWIALAITVLCFLGTSLTSTSMFRGVVLPITGLLMSFVTVLAFAAQRISDNSQAQVYIPTPEEMEAMRKRREAHQAAREAASERKTGSG